MANFMKGLWGIAKHPVDEAKFLWDQTEDIGKPLLKGNFSKAWDEFKGSFGEHNRMMSKNIAVPLGGHNKLTENPDAVAGAIVGGILAGGAMAGGAGASGMGGTTGGTAGGASGLGWQGGAQLGLGGSTYAPTTAFGQSAAAMGGTSGGTGAMGMSTAYAPTTAFGQGAAYGSTGASGAWYNNPKAWGDILQMSGQTLQGMDQQQQQAAPSVSMGAPRGGFSPVKQQSIYGNPVGEAYQDIRSRQITY